MAFHKIQEGLDLPIKGEPAQSISDAKPPQKVAVVASDYVGLRPRLQVEPGDVVKRGQVLFEEKKLPGVIYTSPGAGKVVAVNRGVRRALQTVVVELDEAEKAGDDTAADQVEFESYAGKDPVGLSPEELTALMLESGMWPALRARPFGKVANPETSPHSIFVTAIDTNPLAPSVDAVYAGNEEAFEKGLIGLTRLTEGSIFLCKPPGSAVSAGAYSGISVEEFDGPHPAGTPGLHIHRLDPVNRDKTVWHIGYQDVIALGNLLMTGRLDMTRVVSLAGPLVKNPRLLRTRLGASIDEVVDGELEEGESRVLSGSVFDGRVASGEVLGYLGRYHNQITVLPEDRERVFLGWLLPGFGKFSVVNAFASFIDRNRRKFDFTTSMHGGRRAIVPIGVYERVMPMDIMPTFLLRSIMARDVERAEELGCLELVEEDLALCTFVCPSKIDYGPVLRECLTQIEKEG